MCVRLWKYVHYRDLVLEWGWDAGQTTRIDKGRAFIFSLRCVILRGYSYVYTYGEARGKGGAGRIFFFFFDEIFSNWMTSL